jgi:hypothetical protein
MCKSRQTEYPHTNHAAPHANGTETSPTHDFWTFWSSWARDATTMVAQHPIDAAHAVQNSPSHSGTTGTKRRISILPRCSLARSSQIVVPHSIIFLRRAGPFCHNSAAMVRTASPAPTESTEATAVETTTTTHRTFLSGRNSSKSSTTKWRRCNTNEPSWSTKRRP